MEIAVFGCSFSSGVETIDNGNSWPRQLAILMPEHTIKNYAFGGSSLSWSATQFIKYKRLFPDTFTIFQITMPYRYTVQKPYNFKKILKKTKLPNYFEINQEPFFPFIKPYTPSTKIRKSKYEKFISEYYSHLDNDTEMLIFDCLIDFVSKNSSFYFTHRHYKDTIMSIEKTLGKKFGSYIGDAGFHFNSIGLHNQAVLIKDQIEPRLNSQK